MADERLRYILAVEKEGSFSRAARSLGITQPALSAYVAKLEAKIATPLFDRSYSPLRLTRTGTEYVAMVRDNIQREREFERRVSDLSNLRTGSLTIGGSSFFISTYLPSTVAKFARCYPGISLRIVNGRVPELEKLALDGQIDFFLSRAASARKTLNINRLLGSGSCYACRRT
jgi:DNA-binding transcriptional LysR family regulator